MIPSMSVKFSYINSSTDLNVEDGEEDDEGSKENDEGNESII